MWAMQDLRDGVFIEFEFIVPNECLGPTGQLERAW
jgi:hypothetical protein